jgi:OHCU decarboxylase
MVLRLVNAMDDPDARATFTDFCGAPAWVEAMNGGRPFASPKGLLAAADAAFARVDRDGWLEAFRHHPRIGEASAEREQSASAADASLREQSTAGGTSASERDALVQANRAYEQRFGHVFLISAAGKSAGEILEALRERMSHNRDTELQVAAEEQKTITRLRLERLVG